MSRFRVVASTDVVEAGFLRVASVQVEAPDGERFTRYVVHHPGAVAIVPVDPDGLHIWCVRQFRVATGRELLEIPAGKREHGEPPEASAGRELAEEIAQVPGKLVKLCELFNSPGYCDEYTHIYAGLELTPTTESHVLRAEERAMTVERVAFGDVPELVASGELADAKSIVGILLAERLLA